MKESISSSSLNKGDILSTILKVLGGLALFIPLVAAYFQYQRSVRQDSDKDFRAVIEKLSSEERTDRLAAATSIGTFIVKGGDYYNETIDILINKLSIELDYNVLNAIRGSLLRVERSDYKDVIEKILDINRNIFTQEFVLEKWKEESYTTWLKTKQIVKLDLPEGQSFIKEYYNTYLSLLKDFNDLSRYKQVTADFLTNFFSKVSKLTTIENLEFSYISLNFVMMEDINLFKSVFKNSALSASFISNVNFNGSQIINTTFGLSNLESSSLTNCKIEASIFNDAILKNTDFSNSEFNDVFFIGANLEGAKFNNTKGLKAIYFYNADTDNAIFDSEFKKELNEKLPQISEEEFRNYIANSKLIDQRVEEMGYKRQ